MLRRFSSGSGYFGSTSVPVLFSRFFGCLDLWFDIRQVGGNLRDDSGTSLRGILANNLTGSSYRVSSYDLMRC